MNVKWLLCLLPLVSCAVWAGLNIEQRDWGNLVISASLVGWWSFQLAGAGGGR